MSTTKPYYTPAQLAAGGEPLCAKLCEEGIITDGDLVAARFRRSFPRDDPQGLEYKRLMAKAAATEKAQQEKE